MEIKIRKEKETDFSKVYELNILAFEEKEEAVLVDHLRKNDEFNPQLSLVATLNDEIIGHILFTKIKIIDDNRNESESLALAPMAVSPKYQKKGIGGKLINAGLKKAKELKFKSVIVLGHEHYYPKFGFVPTTRWNIKCPFEVPDNVFMGLELVENGLKNVTGVVQYMKEFDGV
ncbi:MAG: GNAT family N-acetyltransferase [Bacteroidetes bacterium 4572_128]|nr:MAG: GNAT family N-acetyltransferase [Bacteroidetes bacterium 4572_128]